MEPALKDEFQFNVLVVDDDASILSLMKEILSMVPGCNIMTAAEPKEAMKQVIGERVDIIFTDIHMPNHSGLEFLQDIIALEQTPEVIVMSAYPNGENAQQAMELGATSLISKPFEDISVVEVELQKAIKKILRQRSAERDVTLKKIELSQTQKGPTDHDALLRVTIPPLKEISANESAQSVQPTQTSKVPATFKRERKFYDISLLEPLIEIEIERSKRYKKQFAVGFIDLPEDYGLKTDEERMNAREQQFAQLESCVRRSDVLIDAGRDGVAVLGFECNKVGSEVLQHKLMSQGFEHSGFAIYPADGDSLKLQENAKSKVQTKRKLQIVLHETDEFFGRLVQNMLLDPKYHTNWCRSLDETYQFILDESESVKLLVISMTREKDQWKLLARMLSEGLIKWPILLFVDVPLTKEVKVKLSKLGVRAIVNKSASQEEFIYLVQSFVIPKPIGKERKNYRALISVPTTFKLNGKMTSSTTFTLSRDGAFVRDMNPPSSGDIIDFEIFAPGKGGLMKTKAEVLYAVPYFVGVTRFHVAGFALRFIDLTPDQRDHLDEVVSNSLTSYLL
ncbi:MAG: hypothetical protein JWQ35_2655 [Bacteriovoracaceae bacterium]|nr:hypothetical protein [Bacteriovoracaceae bacterium]